MRTYRVYTEVQAEDEDEAIEKLDEMVSRAIQQESTVAGIFNIAGIHWDGRSKNQPATMIKSQKDG